MQNKIFSMLSIAARGRNVVSGEFAAEKAVKSRKAYLVIVANDASDNTKKEFQNMCSFYKTPYFEYGSKIELAHAIGQEMRASLAITNEGLARSVIQSLEAAAAGAAPENNGGR